MGDRSGHPHPPSRAAGRNLPLVVVLTALYMVAEVAGGLVSGSLALLADAGHMLSDVAALGLSVFALWIARRPPTATRTYGYHRVEILAALVNGAALVAIAGWVLVEAARRLAEPPPVGGAVVLAVATGGLAVNLLGMALLAAGRNESLNVRGAWLHLAADALGSVAVMVSGALVWGLGWEFFSPPARAYIVSDGFTLNRLDVVSGKTVTLERFDGSPVAGRVTRHYRGRIFNFVSARIAPTDGGADFRVAMNVPRVPTSEAWSLAGSWTAGQPSNARWSETHAGNTAPPDAVLTNGVELMTVRGREAYPAAILAVAADGSYRVLVSTRDFGRLYPHGVPAGQIAERSRRQSIERSRELARVKRELVARHQARGLNEGAAMLRAHDDMEELGYLPKSPRIVATPLREPPPGMRVFDIPGEYFRVGLFQDIAAAIAAPDSEVDTSTGTYLKYYDDELGLRLKAWRDAGNDRFAVRTGGKLYLLEVRRFDRR